MSWSKYDQGLARLLLIGLLFSTGVSATAQKGNFIVEAGGALTQGASLDTAVYLPYGRHFVDEHPATGHGLQIGVGYVVGGEDQIVRFRTGLRFEFRSYRQDIWTESKWWSPSSFIKSSISSYADEFKVQEIKIGIPLLLRFRIGSRSTVLFGPEVQLVWPQQIKVDGVLTTTTTHYAGPSYEIGPTDVRTSSYSRNVLIDKPFRVQGALLLGYRFRIGERFLLGPDACLFFGNEHPNDRTRMRREYTFWFAYAFTAANKQAN